ncbi:MAG TPA: hypothetical protein VNC16_10435 [Solirubrobacterales bacterium]|jgi:hypothetical protein|nr:hypothetical protein [Solirubrobacterales bacterium]
MALVEIVRELWQRKVLVGIVFLLALFAAILSAYRFSPAPPSLEKRSLSVAAASSQILVDSTDSTLVTGAEAGELDALATRAKIYGQYLSSLAAREEIAKLVGIPPEAISTSGPFSPATGQHEYAAQPSGERADELLQEGAGNRLVFTAQEGVPILTVSAQAATTERAVALAGASFQTLKNYVDTLRASGKPVRQGVTVRQLGAPEGGTLGGSNNMILMFLAFLLVFVFGCAAILVLPTFVARWRALNKLDRPKPAPAPLEPVEDPDPFDPRLASDESDEPLAPPATTPLR